MKVESRCALGKHTAIHKFIDLLDCHSGALGGKKVALLLLAPVVDEMGVLSITIQRLGLAIIGGGRPLGMYADIYIHMYECIQLARFQCISVSV